MSNVLASSLQRLDALRGWLWKSCSPAAGEELETQDDMEEVQDEEEAEQELQPKKKKLKRGKRVQ